MDSAKILARSYILKSIWIGNGRVTSRFRISSLLQGNYVFKFIFNTTADYFEFSNYRNGQISGFFFLDDVDDDIEKNCGIQCKQ